MVDESIFRSSFVMHNIIQIRKFSYGPRVFNYLRIILGYNSLSSSKEEIKPKMRNTVADARPLIINLIIITEFD